MKKFTRALMIVIAGLFSISLSSCFNTFIPELPQKKVPVEEVFFALDKTELDVGETAEIISVSVTPENATNSKVRFSVSNSTILGVSENTVTAKAYGTANVICTSIDDPSITYHVSVNVIASHVKSVSLSLNKESMEVGEYATASVTVLPDTAYNKDYVLVANPTGLVQIEGTKITAKAVGTVSIKAKALENNIESDSVSLEIKQKSATGISLTCDKTTLQIGETSTLNYTVQPNDVVDKEVSFKTESGNTSVISVSSGGVVTANGVGEDFAVVYMKNKPEVSNKIKFTVVSIPVTSINLTAPKTEIEALETVQLSAEVLPSTATDKSVTYSIKSGNNNIIKVSKTGLVTGVYPGEDYVVCSSKGNPDIKDEIKITVIETFAGEISVPSTEVSKIIGETYQINATVLPENSTDKNLSYKAIDRNSYVDEGERFESGQDYTYDFLDPILLNETLNVDFTFDGNGEKQKINLMLGQGWNHYYGYFAIYSDGTLDSNYAGVSVSEPIDGRFRVSFDLTQVNKLNDKPAPTECINMLYIKGSWSGASGSVKVNPEIKEDLLSVNSTGLVTCNNLGEQYVRVYLTNHPSIYKDIKFIISSDPNDPMGQDIFEF